MATKKSTGNVSTAEPARAKKAAKPELKSKMVRVSYWACSDPDHMHKSEASAASCIARESAREERRLAAAGRRKWDHKSRAELLAKHRQGARKIDLARELGLSRGRVAQVLERAIRHERLCQENEIGRLHPPSGAGVAYRYQVRISCVLGRYAGPPLQAMYGLDARLADGVDPGCLDAPDVMPAGGMESIAPIPRGRHQVIWWREGAPASYRA